MNCSVITVILSWFCLVRQFQLLSGTSEGTGNGVKGGSRSGLCEGKQGREERRLPSSYTAGVCYGGTGRRGGEHAPTKRCLIHCPHPPISPCVPSSRRRDNWGPLQILRPRPPPGNLRTPAMDRDLTPKRNPPTSVDDTHTSHHTPTHKQLVHQVQLGCVLPYNL